MNIFFQLSKSKKLVRSIALGAGIGVLAGCSSSLSDYSESQPQFDLKTYFSGDITAWGILQDYSKKVTRRFCVDIEGSWQGNTGILDEVFYFDDGEVQTRVWHLQQNDDGTVTGGAGDVVGQASGEAKGMSFNWHYTLRVPVGDSEYDLAVDDWMFLMDENRVMNRSYMSKLGITVAELSIFFDKTAPIRKCKA